jgi:hypothetical protein
MIRECLLATQVPMIHGMTRLLTASVVAFLSLLLSAKAALASPNEEQCLQSDKLSFKDPGSLKLVVNLGTRGQASPLGGEFFWIRYTATNSYGARIASNMACAKGSNGVWARSHAIEDLSVNTAFLGVLKSTADAMEAQNAELRGCKGNSKCIAKVDEKFGGKPMGTAKQTADAAIKQAKVSAESRVYESVESLAQP